MRLDIYRRAEHDGKFSYLAVPETRNIPEEATNTDWEVEARAVEVDDNAFKKPEAIINSMTLKERHNPGILNASRRKRIAAGAGVTVQDVNAMIRQFEQMQKMIKQMMGNKKGALRAMRNMNFR